MPQFLVQEKSQSRDYWKKSSYTEGRRCFIPRARCTKHFKQDSGSRFMGLHEATTTANQMFFLAMNGWVVIGDNWSPKVSSSLRLCFSLVTEPESSTRFHSLLKIQTAGLGLPTGDIPITKTRFYGAKPKCCTGCQLQCFLKPHDKLRWPLINVDIQR